MITHLSLILCLASPAEEVSDLPAAARLHNARAMVHIKAGAYARGIDELERAYALMPDPLLYRAGRSKVLGSLRSALDRLYTSTGDPAQLLRLQGHLLRYLEALLVALGDAATPEDAAGSLFALRELEQTLAADPPNVVRAPQPGPAVRRSPAAVAAGRPTLPAAGSSKPTDEAIAPRQLAITGGVVLGLGVALLGGVVYGAVVHRRQRDQARQFDAAQGDRWISPGEADKLHGYLERATFGRGLAIGTGIAAAVMTALGTGLLIRAHRTARARRLSASPWWSVTGAGVTVRVQLGSSPGPRAPYLSPTLRSSP